MKIGIVGSRKFTDFELFNNAMGVFFQPATHNVELIVSGGDEGADTLAELYADRNGIKTKIIKPDWKKHGKQAGFIRNAEIVKESDVIIAFWDGQSRGTQDSIAKAKMFKKPTIIIYV